VSGLKDEKKEPARKKRGGQSAKANY